MLPYSKSRVRASLSHQISSDGFLSTLGLGGDGQVDEVVEVDVLVPHL